MVLQERGGEDIAVMWSVDIVAHKSHALCVFCFWVCEIKLKNAAKMFRTEQEGQDMHEKYANLFTLGIASLTSIAIITLIFFKTLKVVFC